MIGVAAAIQADHEDDLAAHDGGGSHRAEREMRRLAQESNDLGRLITEGPIAEDADDVSPVEVLLYFEHRIDLAEGDHVRFRSGIDGREQPLTLRALPLHRHRHLQSRLASPDARMMSKLPTCAPMRKAPLPAAARRNQVLAPTPNQNRSNCSVDQVDAVMNGGREREYVTENGPCGGSAAESPAEVARA